MIECGDSTVGGAVRLSMETVQWVVMYGNFVFPSTVNGRESDFSQRIKLALYTVDVTDILNSSFLQFCVCVSQSILFPIVATGLLVKCLSCSVIFKNKHILVLI